MLAFLSVLLLGVAAASADYVKGCFYNSKSILYTNEAQFGLSDVPYNLCNQLVYRFYTIEADGSITAPSEATYTDPDTGKSSAVSEIATLKATYSDVLFLVGVGDMKGPIYFSTVANNDTARANFVQNAVDLVKDNSFDGMNIAWYYPGLGDISAETDKDQFIVMLTELKNAFSEYGYKLTVTVSAKPSVIDTSYDVENLCAVVDHMYVQGYDYHTDSDGVTGANAPLYAQTTDADDTNLNLYYSINYWISKGATPEKLVLGVPAFAKTYTLSDSSSHDTGAAITGIGNSGAYTNDPGYLAYIEVKELINSGSYNVVQVNDSYVYAYSDDQWISYDNEETIAAKGLLASQWGLGGIIIRPIDRDNFSEGQFPLLSSAIAGYENGTGVIYTV